MLMCIYMYFSVDAALSSLTLLETSPPSRKSKSWSSPNHH